MLTFKPVESKSLAEAVAEQLMAMIAKGQLKPGDRLPTEPELMEQFDVGRSTLREAVKSLVVAGLLETRRSSGTFVSKSYTDYLSQRLNWDMVFSKQDLQHIFDVRCALEEKAAALAAVGATDAQKEKLTQHVEAICDVSKGPENAVEHDMAFHVTIAEASQNPILLNLILSVRQLLHGHIRSGIIQRGYTNQREADVLADLHRPIVDAIRAGRPAEATRAMHEHLKETTGWQLTRVDEDENKE